MIKPDELNMSYDQIEELIKGQQALQKQFNAFAETQDQLVYKISGNPLDRQDRGMIGKLDNVVEDVEGLKEYKKKLINRTVGALAVVTVLWAFIQLAVNYLSNHSH